MEKPAGKPSQKCFDQLDPTSTAAQVVQSHGRISYRGEEVLRDAEAPHPRIVGKTANRRTFSDGKVGGGLPLNQGWWTALRLIRNSKCG